MLEWQKKSHFSETSFWFIQVALRQATKQDGRRPAHYKGYQMHGKWRKGGGGQRKKREDKCQGNYKRETSRAGGLDGAAIERRRHDLHVADHISHLGVSE